MKEDPLLGSSLMPRDPTMREIEEALLKAVEERLTAQKPKWWLAMLPTLISTLLAAIIIP